MGKTKVRKNDEELFTYTIGQRAGDKYYKTSVEALQAAKNIAKVLGYTDGFIYIEEIEQLYGPPIDVDKVIVELQIAYETECDGHYENWLGDLTKAEKAALSEKLNNALKEWLDHYGCKPCLYRQKATKTYKVEAGRVISLDCLQELEL